MKNTAFHWILPYIYVIYVYSSEHLPHSALSWILYEVENLASLAWTIILAQFVSLSVALPDELVTLHCFLDQQYLRETKFFDQISFLTQVFFTQSFWDSYFLLNISYFGSNPVNNCQKLILTLTVVGFDTKMTLHTTPPNPP